MLGLQAWAYLQLHGDVTSIACGDDGLLLGADDVELAIAFRLVGIVRGDFLSIGGALRGLSF